MKETNEKSVVSASHIREVEMHSEFRRYEGGDSPRKRHTALKACCITPVAIILIIVLAVVIAGVVVMNKTPNELGIGDFEFAEGISFNSLGLGDVKFKDMYQFIKELFEEPDESEIVTNPITEEDKVEAKSKINMAKNVPMSASGEPDYAEIITGDKALTYDQSYVLRYADSNLAYMVSEAINQSGDKETSDSKLKSLKDLNANVVEVDVIEESDGTYTLKVICAVDLAPIRSEIDEMIDELGGYADFMKDLIPSRVYVISENVVSVGADGKLITTSKRVGINNIKNDKLTEIVIKALAEFIDKESDDVSGAKLNEAVGDATKKAVGNLGLVGDAKCDSRSVVVDSVRYGVSGLGNGYIQVITYCEG